MQLNQAATSSERKGGAIPRSLRTDFNRSNSATEMASCRRSSDRAAASSIDSMLSSMSSRVVRRIFSNKGFTIGPALAYCSVGWSVQERGCLPPRSSLTHVTCPKDHGQRLSSVVQVSAPPDGKFLPVGPLRSHECYACAASSFAALRPRRMQSGMPMPS